MLGYELATVDVNVLVYGIVLLMVILKIYQDLEELFVNILLEVEQEYHQQELSDNEIYENQLVNVQRLTIIKVSLMCLLLAFMCIMPQFMLALCSIKLIYSAFD